jgi:hypothetical protein
MGVGREIRKVEWPEGDGKDGPLEVRIRSGINLGCRVLESFGRHGPGERAMEGDGAGNVREGRDRRYGGQVRDY